MKHILCEKIPVSQHYISWQTLPRVCVCGGNCILIREKLCVLPEEKPIDTKKNVKL